MNLIRIRTEPIGHFASERMISARHYHENKNHVILLKIEDIERPKSESTKKIASNTERTIVEFTIISEAMTIPTLESSLIKIG